MVGGGGLQVAAGERAPHRVLMMLGAKRRAHHVGGGDVPVGVAVHRFVDDEMAGERLAIHPLAVAAGANDGVHRIFGRHVHDVERRAEHLGDADGPARPLRPPRPAAETGRALRAEDAGGDELALHLEHELAVLGMDGGQGTELEGRG